MADPGLALAIRRSMAPDASPQVPWTDIRDLLRHDLRRTYHQASRALEALRTVNDPQLLECWLDAPADPPPSGNRAQPTEI